MQFYKKVLIIIFFLLCLFSFLLQKGKIEIPFFQNDLLKVVEVVDGDSVILENGENVRYLGINTTEADQPYSKQASDFNKKLVLGKKVRLEFDVEKIDRYGRLLAYIWQDGKFINEKLLEEGFAISVGTQPNIKYQHLFLNAQKQAKNDCKNIWEGLCSFDKNQQCVKIIELEKNFKNNESKNKNNEWITFQNFCDKPINMNSWLLKDNSSSNFYIFKNIILKAKGKLFLYSGCGENKDNKLYWECPEREYMIWNNSGDQAFLFDNDNLLKSYFNY